MLMSKGLDPDLIPPFFQTVARSGIHAPQSEGGSSPVTA